MRCLGREIHLAEEFISSLKDLGCYLAREKKEEKPLDFYRGSHEKKGVLICLITQKVGSGKIYYFQPKDEREAKIIKRYYSRKNFVSIDWKWFSETDVSEYTEINLFRVPVREGLKISKMILKISVDNDGEIEDALSGSEKEKLIQRARDPEFEDFANHFSPKEPNRITKIMENEEIYKPSRAVHLSSSTKNAVLKEIVASKVNRKR